MQQDNKTLLVENNQLRQRVAELEDYSKDVQSKIYPPVPEPFPQRQVVPAHAEHLAMENELDYLRQQVDAYDKRQQASETELSKMREELKAVNDYN